MQEKIITAATVYDNVPTDFNGYPPKNETEQYQNQLLNVRDIIAYSQNIPSVKIMKEVTPTKSIDYLRNFGITTLYKESEVEKGKEHDEHLSLAIGGVTDGITPLEMAGAYAAIANNGEYIEPTFYTKVEDANGNVVLTPNQEKKRVISEQNAYLLQSILQEPVKRGTATYCAIPGIDVGAKTGTTDGSKDRWLCGFTPYYAAACWFGYNIPEEVTGFPVNPAGQIWDEVMTGIHKGLPAATFTRPSGIVEQVVCKKTGCIAVAGCVETYKEIFTPDNLPEKCQGHGAQIICSESGKIATEYCSQYAPTKINNFGAVVPKERLQLWKPIGGKSSSSVGKIEEVCPIHTKPKEVEKPKPVNTVNNTTAGNTTNTTNTTPPKNTTNTNNTSGGGTTNNTTPSTNTTNTPKTP